MNSNANSNHIHSSTHKFFKLILLGFSIIGASAIVTIPFISTSCGESYAEKEVKKCNYTVQGHAVTNVSADWNFYIGEGIKGYISGELYIDGFSAKHTCKVVAKNNFIASNIYLPRYVYVNETIYTIISYPLGSAAGTATIHGKAVMPRSVLEWNFEGLAITSAVFLDNDDHTIPDNAFSNCKIKNIVIPNGIKRIGAWVFEFCEDLTKISIPNSVTEIGADAFFGCRNLIKVNIPDNLTFINVELFDGCDSLTDIIIPNSVNRIGHGAFVGCGLTEINIPNSVTEIGHSAFLGCGLTEINIPDSVTSLSTMQLFQDCRKLSSITLSPNIFFTIPSEVDESPVHYTKFDSGDRSNVHIYVPSQVLNLYISDTNWINSIGSAYIESVFQSI